MSEVVLVDSDGKGVWLKNNEIDCIIGTHSLINECVFILYVNQSRTSVT